MPPQSDIGLLRIGPNIGHIKLFISFIQTLSISHFRKKSEFSFGQVCALKLKFEWLGRFQLRCRSMNFRGTVKLGDKERFNKEQIGVKEPFPVTKFIPIRNIWC